ncbi:FAD-dependent oxidoreductase [Phreatobacter stygius]|uniref:L-aspartate oxidase n=1 Tax=Phreatobacter stygius TaxID=1940610 RepID=A0A4D7B1F3_9HYPH|nr:FAD-binding protein [Phreatobacter stygius]QCI63860.1 FAD-dependent oxidoreductase [Phreatobacter stygius]
MATTPNREAPPDTFERDADVLVIGGGMAGAWAAAAAAAEGAAVVLVDKGYCGTSGVTAAAGPGHWWAPPDPPQARETAIRNRQAIAFGLGDPAWMYAVLDQTWRTLPTLGQHYRFPIDDRGQVNYRAVRGPEYMRALRALIEERGVTVLDHSPALELLARPDGTIGGAQGLQRQQANRPWRVRAGAVVLAAGGTSFLSHLLGARTNTGDGYLMAAEAGAELSGMEFTAAYTIAPERSTMTRTMSYAFATYYDADGREIDAPFGPDQTERIARALLAGPVTCSLHRLPADIQARLPTISPNVMLPFDRWGIDPYRQRFAVTLHTDGTIRGIGGVKVADRDCATTVPGLFVAGDNASRELVAGASSGGGNVNSAWALSSGTWAGRGAVAFARRAGGSATARLKPLGRAGLHPVASQGPVDVAALRAAVRSEMQPYDKNLFRSGDRLIRSRQALDAAWRLIADHAGGHDTNPLAARETAALIATARWSVTAALARDESRGMHRREDRPGLNPALGRRLLVSGFDDVWIRPDEALPGPGLHARELVA